MRYSKVILGIGLSVALAVSQFATANAYISGPNTGQLIFLPSPPISVMPNALENATSAVAFDEAQGVTLLNKLGVDIVAQGTYNAFLASKTLSIPAGTSIDSHLVHSDAKKKPNTAVRAGSITFPSDILGLIVAPKTLGASDYVGAPGTAYAGKKVNRGPDQTQDTLTWSGRTVTFNLQTNSGMDEFRVITAHKNRLTTTITDSPGTVQAGNNVTYLVTVTNDGPTTENAVQVADDFPGTLVSATGPGGPCPVVTPTATCDLGNLAPGASQSATIVVQSPASVPPSGKITDSATAPPGSTPVVSEDTDVVSPVLDTDIDDSPDPVTVGKDVEYILKVTNNGIAPVAEAHVLDTLPSGTTLVSATAPFPHTCSGSAPVDCTLGFIDVGDFAEAHIVVTTPGSVGNILDSATATPGDSNNTDTESTSVETPPEGEVRGFVSPNGSLGIDSPNPAVVTLPNTGDGSPVIITQEEGGTFCDGPCDGTTTTISPIEGYDDASNPIHFTMFFNFPEHGPDEPTSLDEAQATLLASVYKFDATDPDSGGVLVPTCAHPYPAVPAQAIPSPCVYRRKLTENPHNSGNYTVSIEILYLSGDPRFGTKGTTT